VATIPQFVDEATYLAPHDVHRVQVMARYYFASFWCILFTGAVRKWIFPHNSILYLLQDVPISFFYVYGLRSGLFTRGYGSSAHVLPLACMLFAQAWSADMTRAATMTSSQVMIGYAFIMGVQMYPDHHTLEVPASDFLTRSA